MKDALATIPRVCRRSGAPCGPLGLTVKNNGPPVRTRSA